MVDAIFQFKGTLDKYIGDAIMAVFGSPLPLEDHAWSALRTALEMRRRLIDFNKKQRQFQRPEIRIGIGIHSDEVVSGNIGSSKRMELTSIGDGVNLASRLEGTTKQYGCDIVISEKTYQKCADKVIVCELDCIVVKGKTASVKIYELVGLAGDKIASEKLQAIEYYQKGRELYRQCRFSEAIGELEKTQVIFPGHRAAQLHIERCQHFCQSPPPADWDGVWKLTSK